ncbi:MAG: hypothetical protein FJ100_06205 [Deltaproteobacteria bacterium]|nr:hypothetical protein [Deltaproteobacteria bacterium]
MATAETWDVYDPDLPLAGIRYGDIKARMLVVGLGDGTLLAVSPGTIDEAAFAEVDKWGTVTWMLAPNYFHWWGLPVWQKRYPNARIVAHPNALARLRTKVQGLDIGDVSDLRAALPKHVKLHHPPSAKHGETWVQVETAAGRALFVTDGLINEKRLPGFPVGWIMRALGFRAKLMTNPAFKRFFLRDKAAYKAWVATLLQSEPPARFIPAHGQGFHGPETASRLAEATALA